MKISIHFKDGSIQNKTSDKTFPEVKKVCFLLFKTHYDKINYIIIDWGYKYIYTSISDFDNNLFFELTDNKLYCYDYNPKPIGSITFQTIENPKEFYKQKIQNINEYFEYLPFKASPHIELMNLSVSQVRRHNGIANKLMLLFIHIFEKSIFKCIELTAFPYEVTDETEFPKIKQKLVQFYRKYQFEIYNTNEEEFDDFDTLMLRYY